MGAESRTPKSKAAAQWGYSACGSVLRPLAEVCALVAQRAVERDSSSSYRTETRDVLSVLVVDDHPIVRQGLGRVLTAEFPDMHVVEADDGRQAIERMHLNMFDLVLLDLTMPGDHGISLLRRLHRDFEFIPILVVSMHPVDQFAQRALMAGAAGYVDKHSDPRDLAEAIRTILDGGRYVPGALLDGVRQQATPMPHEALSDREYQVLRLIGTGLTVSQISNELKLSVKTVSTYRARILEKLHLRTSAELIHYAVVHKLLP